MRVGEMERTSTNSIANLTTEPVKIKKWKAPVLSKLNINCTYGRVGTVTDSNGSPSDKS